MRPPTSYDFQLPCDIIDLALSAAVSGTDASPSRDSVAERPHHLPNDRWYLANLSHRYERERWFVGDARRAPVIVALGSMAFSASPHTSCAADHRFVCLDRFWVFNIARRCVCNYAITVAKETTISLSIDVGDLFVQSAYFRLTARLAILYLAHPLGGGFGF